MRRILAAPLLIVAVAVAAIATMRSASPSAFQPDVVAVNDLVASVRESWPDAASGLEAAEATSLPRVSVTDAQGRVLASRGAPIDGEREAFRAGASGFDVTVDGTRVGRVLIADGRTDRMAVEQRRGIVRASVAVASIGVLGAVAAAMVLGRILLPFRRMEAFARDVAAGNLDAPLAMDRGNVFGPFTEAFDLMRDRLREARERERLARESKRDLVAGLGHDIRTPVASIAATAELLELTETDAARRAKLGVIRETTVQIDSLVADLFQANAEELAVLRVEPVAVSSAEVAGWLGSCDPEGAIEPFELPDCLVEADPLRMRQVFDNVVANSRKYAGTPIAVSSRVGPGFLAVTVTDSGPGVPEDELDAILGKGVRGSNAAGLPGSGLGLFTASYLMERMGGSLSCRAARPGLAVVVEIPLAR